MGHLDADRVKEIVRFFWSRMEWDIRHFISNICSCLKQKKLNITKAAPLKTTLCCSNGTGQYWFSEPRYLYRRISVLISQYGQLFTFCTGLPNAQQGSQNSHRKSLYWFHHTLWTPQVASYMIRKKNLRIVNLKVYLESKLCNIKIEDNTLPSTRKWTVWKDQSNYFYHAKDTLEDRNSS